MSITIEITQHCLDAVREAHSRMTMSFFGTLVDSSIPLPNGNREIVIQDSTAARLIEVQLAGESLSDTIERVCALAGRPLN